MEPETVLDTAADGAAPTDVATDAPADAAPELPAEAVGDLPLDAQLLGPAAEFLEKGGIAIWAIAALSVVTLAIILWKLWRFAVLGVWRRRRAEQAVAHWTDGRVAEARRTADAGHGLRARLVSAAIACVCAGTWREADTREEVVRVAKRQLAEARSGLRALELIATVAPLLGLLGTVLGMISAFQQLQASGARADPSALAGGIWEALLTTAAGMAVAIPASAALTWFESTTERLRHDLEDIATRILTRRNDETMRHAAE